MRIQSTAPYQRRLSYCHITNSLCFAESSTLITYRSFHSVIDLIQSQTGSLGCHYTRFRHRCGVMPSYSPTFPPLSEGPRVQTLYKPTFSPSTPRTICKICICNPRGYSNEIQTAGTVCEIPRVWRFDARHSQQHLRNSSLGMSSS